MSDRREMPFSDMDIEIVRRYATSRVNAASLRQIASRIGMQHNSLDKFLTGSSPYARNRSLLCEWYLREHQVHPVQATPQVPPQEQMPEDPGGLLDVLLSELHGEAQTEARMRITNALAQAYKRMGAPEPVWLFSRR